MLLRRILRGIVWVPLLVLMLLMLVRSVSPASLSSSSCDACAGKSRGESCVYFQRGWEHIYKGSLSFDSVCVTKEQSGADQSCDVSCSGDASIAPCLERVQGERCDFTTFKRKCSKNGASSACQWSVLKVSYAGQCERILVQGAGGGQTCQGAMTGSEKVQESALGTEIAVHASWISVCIIAVFIYARTKPRQRGKEYKVSNVTEETDETLGAPVAINGYWNRPEKGGPDAPVASAPIPAKDLQKNVPIALPR